MDRYWQCLTHTPAPEELLQILVTDNTELAYHMLYHYLKNEAAKDQNLEE